MLDLIEKGKSEGAQCLLDGSNSSVKDYPNGNWVSPTLFKGVTPEMAIYKEEIFGPVLVCIEVDSLEDAIALVNANPYGNGTSIFTASGGAARKYQHQVLVGQVGSMFRSRFLYHFFIYRLARQFLWRSSCLR